MQLKDSPIQVLEKAGELKYAQVKYAMAKGLDKPYDFVLAEPLFDDFNEWCCQRREAAKTYAGILKLTGVLGLEDYDSSRKVEYGDDLDTIRSYFGDGEIDKIERGTFCILPYKSNSLVLTQNPLTKCDLIRADFSCRKMIAGVFGLSEDSDKKRKLLYVSDLAKNNSDVEMEMVTFDDQYMAYAAHTKSLKPNSFR